MSLPRFKYYLDQCIDKPEPMFAMMVSTGMSDVCGETLLENGKPIPLFPDYKTWRREVTAKRRCGRCWRTVRGLPDLARHSQNYHLNAPIHMPAKENQYGTPRL